MRGSLARSEGGGDSGWMMPWVLKRGRIIDSIAHSQESGNMIIPPRINTMKLANLCHKSPINKKAMEESTGGRGAFLSEHWHCEEFNMDIR